MKIAAEFLAAARVTLDAALALAGGGSGGFGEAGGSFAFLAKLIVTASGRAVRRLRMGAS